MKKNLTDLEKSLIKAGSKFEQVLNECILALFKKAVKKNNVYTYKYSSLDSDVVRYIEYAPEESYLCENGSDEIKWDVVIDKNIKVIVFAEHSEDNEGYIEGYTGDDGQVYVDLEKDGIVKSEPLAYLVAGAFVPNHNGYKYVIHKDGDKQNNCADNLEWSETPEE